MKIFCVYTKRIRQSVRVAKRCVNSGKALGLNIELYESVYYHDVKAEAKKLGLKLKYRPVIRGKTCFKKKKAPASRIANGITHYKLYKYAVENNESICIVEHDSIFVSEPPEPIEDGIIQISSHSPNLLTPESLYNCVRAIKMKKYEPEREYNWDWPVEGIIKHPLSGTNGTSGYVISPGAAKKMMEYIQSTGVAFADRIRTEHIGEGNLYLQIPQSVLCDHDITSASFMTTSRK